MLDLDALIAGCKKQDSKSQHALYKQYAALLMGVCMRYANDVPEAEDILQEGFLKIFRHINDYSGEGHFVAWMKKIMANTAITYYHKNKRHHAIEEIEEHEPDANETSLAESNLSANDLLALINKMPEGYKLVFNLYAIEGFKHKEIAEQLNIDESTSKTQLLRAKKWLAKELKVLEQIKDE